MKQKLIISLWIFAVGGIFGFVYEELFYRIDLGEWVKRGCTFGPWIPIYGFGALLIMLATYKIRNKPLLVFLLSSLVCGLLEYSTGWVLYKVFSTRLWDYNTEMWNWLNVGGFVCMRSVLFFGVSGLILQYGIYPMLERLLAIAETKCPKCVLQLPGIMFLLDMLIYRIVR